MSSISITVHEVNGLPERAHLVSRTDPFIELRYDDLIWKTKTQKNAGASAVFEDVWTFSAHPSHTAVLITAYDSQHITPDSKLAEGQFTILLEKGYFFEGAIPLQQSKRRHSCHDPTVTITVRIV